MKKFILGMKIGMSQVFENDGKRVPVTLIEAGPVVVTQLKTMDKDGYQAVQVGFGKRKHPTKALAGHLKNLAESDRSFRWLKEFRLDEFKVEGKDLKIGERLGVDIFKEGDLVKVAGTSKAKGFQGVVKRHGFAGGARTHGQKHSEREAGSIGVGGRQRVIKGIRMAGRMGGERVSVQNLKVIQVDSANNLLVVKGAVPGRRGILLEVIQ